MAQGYRPWGLVARALLVVAAFLGAGTTPAAEPWVVEGRVVGISDGDTLTILDDAKTQHKVRIAGIDAPEKGQAFGTASKESLSRLVFNRRVEVRCYKKDRYGREVCRVYEGLRDVGLEQVRAGMAWHFKEYQHEQSRGERDSYMAEEQSARADRRGLWKDAKPVPPWHWRRGKADPTARSERHSSPGAQIQPFTTPTAPPRSPPDRDPMVGCVCGSGDYCVGPRGGIYCTTSGGNKRYVPR